MKTTALEAFLFGVAVGAGMVLLVLNTHEPDYLAASLEAIAERGRARKAREEERRVRRERLREVGFSDEEINEIL